MMTGQVTRRDRRVFALLAARCPTAQEIHGGTMMRAWVVSCSVPSSESWIRRARGAPKTFNVSTAAAIVAAAALNDPATRFSRPRAVAKHNRSRTGRGSAGRKLGVMSTPTATQGDV
jgi:hypothetical protein